MVQHIPKWQSLDVWITLKLVPLHRSRSTPSTPPFLSSKLGVQISNWPTLPFLILRYTAPGRTMQLLNWLICRYQDIVQAVSHSGWWRWNRNIWASPLQYKPMTRTRASGSQTWHWQNLNLIISSDPAHFRLWETWETGLGRWEHEAEEAKISWNIVKPCLETCVQPSHYFFNSEGFSRFSPRS